jgi:concanavalin A-like lectin/glucanase superfamily protein
MALLNSRGGLLKSKISIPSNTVFYVPFNGANGSTTFTDLKGKSISVFGAAQISTAQSTSGGSSGLFNGTSSYAQALDSVDFDFGTGAFKIDFYFYLNSLSGNQCFIAKYATSSERYLVYLESTTGKITFKRQNTGGADRITPVQSTTSPVINTWYRVTVDRVGDTIRLVVNNVIEGTTSAAGVAIQGAGNLIMGALQPSSGFAWHLNGYLDELAITKG